MAATTEVVQVWAHELWLDELENTVNVLIRPQ